MSKAVWFIPSIVNWWFMFADEKMSQSDTYTVSLLGVQAFRCQRGSGAQHSSSASLMGGIKLLVDLYWLTWLTARVFTGLICMVLRWVFSGSSVNHVFSEKEPKSYRDKEEGHETVNATISVFAFQVPTEHWEDIVYCKRNNRLNWFCWKKFWHDKKYAQRWQVSITQCPIVGSFRLCNVTHLMFVIYTNDGMLFCRVSWHAGHQLNKICFHTSLYQIRS